MNSGLVLGPVFAILPACILFAVCTSLSRGANYLLTLVYSALSFLLCASQLVYYRIFGTFYTFFSMTNGAGAFQFMGTITAAIRENLLTLVLMAAPLLVLLFGGRNRFYFRRRRAFAPKLALVILALLVQTVTVFALPLLGGKDAKGKLQKLLEKAAGGKILGHDLYLYVRQKAAVWGIDKEYISSAALDDLQCAWCCTQGFLQAKESESIPILCVFDSEEVGSSSVQGAASDLLESMLHRICAALGLEPEQMLSQSFMISADNAHAVHPNHPEYADPSNAPVVNNGIVLKFNANQRYCTDGVSAAVFRKVCAMANVPVQTYCNRADVPGGSTLGNISLAHVSVPTADIGLAQLAMHSCYETAGVKDAMYLEDAMKHYYGSTLSVSNNSYSLQA